MKRFIRCVCFALAFVMCFATTAFAAEEVAPRASNFFLRYGGYLTLTSGSTFAVTFDVTATGIMDELGATTIEVQRSSNGSSGWLTMKTFSRNNYSQMIGKGVGRHSGSVTYTGVTGYYYRAYITFYAKNSSGIGQYTYYTPVIQIPSN